MRPVKPDHCCARVYRLYWKRLKLLCLTTGTKRSICHRFCLTVTPERRYEPLTTGTDGVTCLSLLLQVCAVHTMQALVRGSGLGVAVLQFAPDVAILSLTLLSSPCWAMRNAALQLFSETAAHHCICNEVNPSSMGFSLVCAPRFTVHTYAWPTAQQ